MQLAKKPRVLRFESGQSDCRRGMSDDEWSYVVSFLCKKDAWKSAVNLANMSGTCHTWRNMNLWQYWTREFKVFPFTSVGFPRVLVPFMESAREHNGVVTRKSAMEHLKLSGEALKNVPLIFYKYRKIEDVLQAATSQYGSITALEQHVLKCKKCRASRERNKLLKEERELDVCDILFDIDAMYMMYSRTFKELLLYVDKGKGNLDTILEKALEKKRVHDERTPMHDVISERPSILHYFLGQEIVADDDYYYIHERCEQNEIVIRYIFDGIGNDDTVLQACLEEIERFKNRLPLSAQERDQRLDDIVAELHLHHYH